MLNLDRHEKYYQCVYKATLSVVVQELKSKNSSVDFDKLNRMSFAHTYGFQPLYSVFLPVLFLSLTRCL